MSTWIPWNAKRRLLLAAGASCLLPRFVTAHEHTARHGTRKNPYGILSHGACSRGGLACASAATPYFSNDGTLWVAWTGNGKVEVARSSDLGNSFSAPIEIASHGANLDVGPDSRPTILGNGRGGLVVLYAYFYDNKWNARVNFATSRDGGLTFSRPRPITANTASQRFPVAVVDGSGQIFVAWIDKRVAAQEARHGRKHEGASIAYAWSEDGGRSFGADHIAYDPCCQCCRPAVALSPQGLPVMMFRAIFPGSVRDHATLPFLSHDKPGSVERVSVDHWVTHACPHHGPSLAISERGTFHCGWYTQGSIRSGVFYARSLDGGRSFSDPVRVGNPETLTGRPFLLCVQNSVWLTWKEFDGTRTSAMMQYSTDDGATWSHAARVATTRGFSDHPLLIAIKGRAYLSWLTHGEGYRLIDLKKLRE